MVSERYNIHLFTVACANLITFYLDFSICIRARSRRKACRGSQTTVTMHGHCCVPRHLADVYRSAEEGWPERDAGCVRVHDHRVKRAHGQYQSRSHAVLLSTEEQFETWLKGSPKEAFALARQFPPDAMRLVQFGAEMKDLLAE